MGWLKVTVMAKVAERDAVLPEGTVEITWSGGASAREIAEINTADIAVESVNNRLLPALLSIARKIAYILRIIQANIGMQTSGTCHGMNFEIHPENQEPSPPRSLGERAFLTGLDSG
jgi:hypothetical protein